MILVVTLGTLMSICSPGPAGLCRLTRGHELLELGSLIQQALHLVQTRLRQQKVEVELNGADRPITVRGPDQFLSVLVNLFLNALDAMPQGGKLQVTVEQNPAGEVRVQVADTGPGSTPRWPAGCSRPSPAPNRPAPAWV